MSSLTIFVTTHRVTGDECRESSDCNIHKGLCCRLTRRQRMQPKKVRTLGHQMSNIYKDSITNNVNLYFSSVLTSLTLMSALAQSPPIR